MGGYIRVNEVGEIISVSGASLPNSILIADDMLFNDICTSIADYKWIDDKLIKVERPSVYHAWNGKDWFFDEQALQNARDAMWQEIKAYRDEREEGGIKLAIDKTEYWFHSDTRSLIKYLFLLFLATVFKSYFQNNITWKTMQNDVIVTLTPQIIINIFFAVMAMGNTVHQQGRTHRTAMMQSKDPLNYDFSRDWPPIFGE